MGYSSLAASRLNPSRRFNKPSPSSLRASTTRLFEVGFHDCGWRELRLKGGLKEISLHSLSLIGYVGGAALILAILVGIAFLTLTFLGVPMPWTH